MIFLFCHDDDVVVVAVVVIIIIVDMYCKKSEREKDIRMYTGREVYYTNARIGKKTKTSNNNNNNKKRLIRKR